MAVYLALVLGLHLGYRVEGIVVVGGVLAVIALLVALRAATRSVDLYPDRMVVHGYWPRTVSRREVHGFENRQDSGLGGGGSCVVMAQDDTGLGLPICRIPGRMAADIHSFTRALEAWAGVDPVRARRTAVQDSANRIAEITRRLEDWHLDD